MWLLNMIQLEKKDASILEVRCAFFVLNLFSSELGRPRQQIMDDQRSLQRITTIRHHLQPASSGTPSMCANSSKYFKM